MQVVKVLRGGPLLRWQVPRATTDSTLSLLQVVKAMEADPHVNRKNLPVRTGRAFLDGFNAVASKSSTIGLPLLILHSPIDKVCRLLGRLQHKAGMLGLRNHVCLLPIMVLALCMHSTRLTPVASRPAFHHQPSMLQICVPAATKKFSEQVKSKDLTVHWIEGGAHDMMQGGSSAMAAKPRCPTGLFRVVARVCRP